MKATICATILCLVLPTQACINKTGTKYGGGEGAYFGWRSLEISIERNLRADGETMEATLRGATDFKDRSDYAVALMYLGRSQEAVELLKKLEQEEPGHYFVAANLGTAYELTGNNTEALRWINEGIKRNPASHSGTEWLHAKILEAKIAQQKDSKFFDNHSVLELQPGQIKESITLGTRTISPKELMDAIIYQLGERLQFVKPPDPAVASLLFDYAAIEAATASMESAKHILELAAKYGYPPARVNALSAEFDRRLAWAHTSTYATYAIIAASVIALIVMFRKMRNVSKRAVQA